MLWTLAKDLTFVVVGYSPAELEIWYHINRNIKLFVCLILQKGCGYHLDLLMVGIMLGICSLMGLPWFVAATVLSISHVNSLKVESQCSAPGEQPKFLGIREQRVTGLMIFVLMGLSVFMTSVLKVKDSFLKIFSLCFWFWCCDFEFRNGKKFC